MHLRYAMFAITLHSLTLPALILRYDVNTPFCRMDSRFRGNDETWRETDTDFETDQAVRGIYN